MSKNRDTKMVGQLFPYSDKIDTKGSKCSSSLLAFSEKKPFQLEGNKDGTFVKGILCILYSFDIQVKFQPN